MVHTGKLLSFVYCIANTLLSRVTLIISRESRVTGRVTPHWQDLVKVEQGPQGQRAEQGEEGLTYS